MDDLQVQVPLPVRPEPHTRQVFDPLPAAAEADLQVSIERVGPADRSPRS